jgi:hypothetical protein
VGELLEARADVLVGAGATHAKRFVKVPPLPGLVPAEVLINPPLKLEQAAAEGDPQARSSDASVSLR